nr:MAG TPA: hypothetical protein [Caudoviricetes sp.]
MARWGVKKWGVITPSKEGGYDTHPLLTATPFGFCDRRSKKKESVTYENSMYAIGNKYT